MAGIPLTGALYANPPIPTEFGTDAITVAAAVPVTTLATCYAVTTGPDRNVYWIYGHMAASATGIPLAPVGPPTCFETRDSIAVSQRKTRPRQICVTCQRAISTHATAAQATTAFTAHAGLFPATHAVINAPVAPGVTAPMGYAQSNGITAPIPAPVIVPLPPAAPVVAAAAAVPAPVAVAAPVVVAAPVAAAPVLAAPGIAGNTPSTQATAAQFKLLTEMVKINPQLIWSDQQDAHRFMDGLESILEFSPVLPTHWTTLIPMMIPGAFETERTWVRNNIMNPWLTWNAAKAAFIAHFQRGDYMDGLRWLYNDCRQQPQESTQEYSRRFQTITTQLAYADGDVQSIYRYIGGLHSHVQQKMTQHKMNMRTVGGVPGWDFTSLVTTVQLAITIGTQPIYTQRTTTTTTPPVHLRHSALANPSRQPHTTTTSSSFDSSHPKTRQKTRKRKETTQEATSHAEEKGGCIHHPESKTHTTETCRKELRKQQKANSPPKAKQASGKQVPTVALPPQRQSQQQTTNPQQRQPQTRARSSSQTNLSRIQCFRCQQWGHFANACPQSQSQQPANNNTGNNNSSHGRANSRARRARVGFSGKNEIKEYDESSPVSSPSPATVVAESD